MNLLRALFGRRSAERRDILLRAIDQQCLRALFDVRGSLSDAEIIQAVRLERPEWLPEEVHASLLKLRQHGLVERDELARHRIAKGGRDLRGIVPHRATSNIVYYG